jgi:drug/metabolite transporter (DMT)-like permease
MTELNYLGMTSLVAEGPAGGLACVAIAIPLLVILAVAQFLALTRGGERASARRGRRAAMLVLVFSVAAAGVSGFICFMLLVSGLKRVNATNLLMFWGVVFAATTFFAFLNLRLIKAPPRQQPSRFEVVRREGR